MGIIEVNPRGGVLDRIEAEPEIEVAPDATPLEFLQAVYRNPHQPMPRRMKAAEVAAVYTHPKLSAVANIVGYAGQIEAAMKARGLNPVIDCPPKAIARNP